MKGRVLFTGCCRSLNNIAVCEEVIVCPMHIGKTINLL